MSTIGPTGGPGGAAPTPPSEPSVTQLANQLHSDIGEVVQSMRQALENTDLASKADFQGHLSQSLQALGDSSAKAQALGGGN